MMIPCFELFQGTLWRFLSLLTLGANSPYLNSLSTHREPTCEFPGVTVQRQGFVGSGDLGGCWDPTSCSAELRLPRATRTHGCARDNAELALQRSDQRECFLLSTHLGANATQNYTDVNRTYHDATEALSYYPSLSVRTDVYST